MAEGHHGGLSEQDKEANVAATTPYANYLWDIRYIDAPVARWRNADLDVGWSFEETLYYCNDANMNVTALVGADGTVVERSMYDPYGRVTFLDASFSPRTNNRSAYDNEILYCGYRFDPETGRYYVRHRHYHPLLGTWELRDPLGYVDAMNVLAYVRQRPTCDRDPFAFGLFTRTACVFTGGYRVTAKDHTRRFGADDPIDHTTARVVSGALSLFSTSLGEAMAPARQKIVVHTCACEKICVEEERSVWLEERDDGWIVMRCGWLMKGSPWYEFDIVSSDWSPIDYSQYLADLKNTLATMAAAGISKILDSGPDANTQAGKQLKANADATNEWIAGEGGSMTADAVLAKMRERGQIHSEDSWNATFKRWSDSFEKECEQYCKTKEHKEG